jgi:hypothetical protein
VHVIAGRIAEIGDGYILLGFSSAPIKLADELADGFKAGQRVTITEASALELMLARETQSAREESELRHFLWRVQANLARPAGHAVPRTRVQAQRGQRVRVEGRAHGGKIAGADDDPPMNGGSRPLPPESRRRMKSRISGSRLVVSTCLLTKASAPLSEAMSR